ncbi:hypothetical protein DVQ18_07580 [Yersinia enterocolitica]|nr:hypothetical protein [Yersinia enterocolitica]EKN6103849.1 hypothetical protein [Yersinia enterocolitica]
MVMKVSPSVLLHDFNIIVMTKSRSNHRKVITGPHFFFHIPACQLFLTFMQLLPQLPLILTTQTQLNYHLWQKKAVIDTKHEQKSFRMCLIKIQTTARYL